VGSCQVVAHSESMCHNLGMRTMSIRELRASLSTIGEIADQEGEVVLTCHGRPLARLVSLKSRRVAPSHADLRAVMPPMATPSEQLVRAERDGAAVLPRC
jgi:prevent-host-death family protein